MNGIMEENNARPAQVVYFAAGRRVSKINLGPEGG